MSIKVKNLLFICVFFTSLIMAVLLVKPVFAASFDYDLVSEYSIAGRGEAASVKTIVEVTNNSDESPPVFTLPITGANVSDIVAEAQDGATVKTALNEEGTAIAITQDSDFSGKNRLWSFTVTYKAELIEQLGAVSALQIPAFNFGDTFIQSHTIRVATDLALGEVVNRGPKPDKTSVGIGQQVLTYTNEAGAFDQALSYYFGESSVVQATYETQISNDSLWWKTVTVPLPPDTNQQQVFIESIEPRPTNVRLDVDGNVLAEYSLSPKRTINVSASVLLAVRAVSYSLDEAQTVATTDPVLVERYTSLNDVWRSFSSEIDIPSGSNAAQTVELVYNAVVATVAKDTVPMLDFEKARVESTSLRVADELVGALRSKKVPARIVVGKVISDGNMLLDQALSHAWVEAYVNGTGWITLDPILGSKSTIFGTSDVVHMGFALWGAESQYPPVDITTWQALYVDKELPANIAPAEINSTKYVIFPGISLLSASVTQSPGTIVDNGLLAVSNGGESFELGSLAPFQTAPARTLRLGASAFSSETFEYSNKSSAKIIATATTNVSYMPFLGLLTVIGGGFLTVFLVRRKQSGVVASRDSLVMHAENHGESIEEQDLLYAPDGEADVHEVIVAAADSFSDTAPQEPLAGAAPEGPMSQEIEPGTHVEVVEAAQAVVADSKQLPQRRRPQIRKTDMHIQRSRFSNAVSPRRAAARQQARTHSESHAATKKSLVQG